MIKAICQIKIPKLVLLAVLLLAAVVLWHPSPAGASTTCPTDTSRGTVTGTFSTPLSTTYRVYARMMASSSANNTFVLEIDGTCYNMGGKNLAGAALPVYSSSADWTNDSADWVDAESGSTTPLDLNLSSGTHNYVMIGNADAVRVDRVLFTQVSGASTCVPTGTGDNCAGTQVAPSQVSVPFYMQSGGPGFTDSTDGVTWKADQYYTQTNNEGASGNSTTSTAGGDGTTCVEAVAGGENEGCTGHAITIPSTDTTGPKNQEAYQTERWGGFSYDIPIANGTYNVLLNFAEINPASNGSGSRIFNVSSSNSTTPLLSNYNLNSVGSYTADAQEFTVTVTNGDLNLAFAATAASSNAAKLSSLEILTHTTTPPPPTCSANANPAPVAPTGLTQSSTNTTYTAISFSWTAGTPSAACNVDTYYIYRDGTMIGQTTNGSTLTYTDTTAGSAGTSHSYQVKTHDSGGNVSILSNAGNFSTKADNEAPNVPTLSSATASGSTAVNLAWTAVTDNPNPGGSGVKGYNIYRTTGSSTSFGTTPLNGSTPVTGTTYADNGLTASTKYNYEVTAVDNVGNESAPSSILSATTAAPTCSGNPAAPSGFSAGAKTSTSIAFSWSTASTASAGCTLSGYNVYQVFPGTSNTPVELPSNTVSGTNKTASISSLTPNTSYSYVVVGYDTSGHVSGTVTSSTTPSITLSTSADVPPSAPGTVTAVANSPTQVTVTWTAGGSGTTGYNVYRNGNIIKSNQAVSSGLSYIDNSASQNTSYTYSVSALDQYGGESTLTAGASVKTPVAVDTTPPNAPVSVSAPVVSAQSIQLSWPASTSSDVASYNVYLKVNGSDVSVGSTNSTSFTYQPSSATCLEPGVTYTFDVKAVDTSGNVSTTAATTTVTTTTTGAYQGDVNCSLKVEFGDLTIMARNWRLTGNYLPWQGDVNGDGTVNFTDLQALANNWGKSW